MARPPIAPFLTLGAIFLFFLLRELYASYRHRTVQAKRQVDIAQIAAVHLPPPLPPLQAQLFDRAGPLSTFERAGATPGTWRAVGGVPIADEGGSHVVNVVATDADPDSAGVRGRMKLAGVIPLLDERLRLDLLALTARSDFEWTHKRHTRYPTTDQELFRFPSLDERVSSLLRTRLMPGLAVLYGLDLSELSVYDLFVIKYEHKPGEQRALPRHIDGSCFSFIVQLNALDEFVGGGTKFAHASHPISVPAGHALLFNGRLLHAGANISSGARYLLAGFVGFHADAVAYKVMGARTQLSGGHACKLEAQFRPGPYYNYQLLLQATGLASGGQLVHDLAARSRRLRVRLPRTKLEVLRIWCQRWVRANSTTSASRDSGKGDASKAIGQRRVARAGAASVGERFIHWRAGRRTDAMHGLLEDMPLEIHVFLHQAVGWPLALRVGDQPTKRMEVLTRSGASPLDNSAFGAGLEWLYKQGVG